MEREGVSFGEQQKERLLRTGLKEGCSSEADMYRGAVLIEEEGSWEVASSISQSIQVIGWYTGTAVSLRTARDTVIV